MLIFQFPNFSKNIISNVLKPQLIKKPLNLITMEKMLGLQNNTQTKLNPVMNKLKKKNKEKDIMNPKKYMTNVKKVLLIVSMPETQ